MSGLPTTLDSITPGRDACSCDDRHDAPKLVVLTGGPGAGKTAVLELVKQRFCEHVLVLPEAASILFLGGFPRPATDDGLAAAQRAIFHVQQELEAVGAAEDNPSVLLCDRGVIDGLAYWPGDEASYFADVRTTKARELARYAAVIHLRTPGKGGYNHRNPARIESAERAAALDVKIEAAWAGHPHVHFVQSADDFVHKAQRALDLIEHELPPCCRHLPHEAGDVGGA